METQLLVRLYRVGFGDCIYIEIPDANDPFSMLIDCGTSASAEKTLKPVVQHLRANLPKGQDRRPRLDLLVVTHPHADHIKGFDPTWFEGIIIGRIWMTAFMKKDHPQAQKALAFEQAAYLAAKSLSERPGLHLAPGTQALLERSLSLNNDSVFTALRSGMATTHPRLYAARDVAAQLSESDRQEHGLSLEGGVTCFRGFQDPSTCLRILAPEWDIDSTYLGQFTLPSQPFSDPILTKTEAYTPGSEAGMAPGNEPGEAPPQDVPQPDNISARDFRLLRSGLLYSALAFSQEDDDLKNNVSVVLLLEWRGRRLLFTGDAEWNGTGVRPGQRNCSWDVMLAHPGVRDLLTSQPLDLYKIAHHGSHNGSPYDPKDDPLVLDKIAAADRTHIVISTVTGVHGKKNPVPYAPLLTRLGQLAKNKQVYPACEPELASVPQPQRTDQETDATAEPVRYFQVRLEPLIP